VDVEAARPDVHLAAGYRRYHAGKLAIGGGGAVMIGASTVATVAVPFVLVGGIRCLDVGECAAFDVGLALEDGSTALLVTATVPMGIGAWLAESGVRRGGARITGIPGMLGLFGAVAAWPVALAVWSGEVPVGPFFPGVLIDAFAYGAIGCDLLALGEATHGARALGWTARPVHVAVVPWTPGHGGLGVALAVR
jgi:hypothetical protein